jgi:hypothetical protein
VRLSIATVVKVEHLHVSIIHPYGKNRCSSLYVNNVGDCGASCELGCARVCKKSEGANHIGVFRRQ